MPRFFSPVYDEDDRRLFKDGSMIRGENGFVIHCQKALTQFDKDHAELIANASVQEKAQYTSYKSHLASYVATSLEAVANRGIYESSLYAHLSWEALNWPLQIDSSIQSSLVISFLKLYRDLLTDFVEGVHAAGRESNENVLIWAAKEYWQRTLPSLDDRKVALRQKIDLLNTAPDEMKNDNANGKSVLAKLSTIQNHNRSKQNAVSEFKVELR